MADLPDCLLIVIAEIDAEVEAAWNTWYDTVHLPDALACPGIHVGRRYVSESPASVTVHGQRTISDSRTYTTVYEIDGPEVLETPEFQAMRGWHEFAGRISAWTQVVRGLPH